MAQLHGLMATVIYLTPDCHRGHHGRCTGHGYGPNLRQMAKTGLWPTPQSHDAGVGNPDRVGRFGTEHGGRNLNDEVALWRTPSAHITEPKSSVKKLMGRTPEDPQVGLADQVGGQLNPRWVEWLMGVPIGWVSLEPLVTGSFRRWSQGFCGE